MPPIPCRCPRKASADTGFRKVTAAHRPCGARKGLAGIGARAGQRYHPGMSGDSAPDTGGQPPGDIPAIPAAGPVEPGPPQLGGKPDRWWLVETLANLVDGITSIWP